MTMASGLLELTGHIDLSQLWPAGTSDADTSKIRVTTTGDAFRFRTSPRAPWRVTHAFEHATVKGRTSKAPIDKQGRVTVRLQGIDAPELHYRPAAILKRAEQTNEQHELYLEWNEDYRQPLAESATLALRAFLEQASEDPLPCVVRSNVDQPNDVFDTYGRFVGDIFVRIAGKERHVNRWLVEQGWALPGLYNSMSPEEISGLIEATTSAYENDLGVWPSLADEVGKLDWKMVFRGKGAPPQPDAGGVLIPKLYRRLATWAINRRAKMVTGTFARYLAAHPDPCFVTNDFLEQGPAATVRELAEFVDTDGTLLFWPEELVFKDAPSRLIGPDGPVVDW
jgi:endonuclease YncB( thermonuclease family)